MSETFDEVMLAMSEDQYVSRGNRVNDYVRRLASAHARQVAVLTTDRDRYQRLYIGATEGAFGLRILTERDQQFPDVLKLCIRLHDHGLIHRFTRGELELTRSPLSFFGATLCKIGEQFKEAARKEAGK